MDIGEVKALLNRGGYMCCCGLVSNKMSVGVVVADVLMVGWYGGGGGACWLYGCSRV